METCGHTRWKVFERLLPHLDLVLFDLKHLDPEIHRQWTGMDNEVILSNLRRLAELGAPVTVRVPLIPGFNADAESISAIAHFVATARRCAKACEPAALPHTRKSKICLSWPSISRWKVKNPITPEMVRELTQVLEAQNIEVTIGS